MTSPITFCLSTANNLNYLKLAIAAVRKYSYYQNCPFIIYAESCTDGTYKWLNENKEKYNLTFIIENNTEDKVKGIGASMNLLAACVQTKFILFLHADMVVSKNWDKKLLDIFEKYPTEKLWVNSYRIEPNIWQASSRPGTWLVDMSMFGYKYDDFEEEYFMEFSEHFSKLNNNIEIPKGEGVSGLIKTKDFLNIKCDPQFIAYYDDMDIFLRMRLAGYKFIITSNSVVFHFGSRSNSSNFQTDDLIRSEKSKHYEIESRDKFIQKWGFLPINDEFGFVTFPPNVDRDKLKHLIKL